MVERKLFNEKFEPIVQPGEYIRIVPKKEEYEFFVVEYVEAIPSIEKDFGAIKAGETVTKECGEIQLMDSELGQWRFIPITDGLYVIGIRKGGEKASPFWQTKNTTGRVGKELLNYKATENLQMTEFFNYENEDVYFDLYNSTTTDMSESKVLFFGYVLSLSPIKEKPSVYKVIPLEPRKVLRGGR